MKKIFLFFAIFGAAGLLLWAFPFFSVALSAPTQAELAISKSDGVSRMVAGDGMIHTYVITVTNPGTSPATGVVVADTWPAGFTRGAVVSSQVGCDLTNPTDFTCNLGDILAGGHQTITAAYTVPAGTSAGDYTNHVQASSPDVTGPATATDVTTVLDRVNLGISKSDGVTQVTAGDGVTYHYTIIVTNNSPSLAAGVGVTDTWPAGFTRGAVVASQGACVLTNPTNFTCALGDILAGAQATITVAYTVPAGTPAGNNYTNTAVANALNANAPVTASDINTVLTNAILAINKTDGVSQITAGNGVTYHYSIVVTNNGPSVASGVVVTDTWPVGFTRGSVVWSQGGCVLTNPTNFTCALGNILAGGQQTITADYTVPSGTPDGSYTNTSAADALNAGAPVTEPDTNNVITRANLSLSKLDDPDPVNTGETLTYTLTVNNAGPSDAVGVVISDTLPLGTTFNDALSSPTCDAVGRIVTCNLGGIVNNGSSQTVIKVTVNTTIAGTITNQARVTASTIDPSTGNNFATASTTVDVGKPVVNWVAPVTNDVYYYIDCLHGCPHVDFEVNAVDDVGVQRVEFYRWDHVLETYFPIGIDSSPPSPFTWLNFDTSILPIGYNQIYARAFDTSGNVSARKKIFIVKPAYTYLPLVKR